MSTLKDYDVLRLIEHNRNCYVSSDNIKGWVLINWIKCHPYISKKMMIQWMHEIVQQLTKVHKCHGNPCYQYVNPYCIIVTEEGEICFLDMEAKSNKNIEKLMKLKNIRDYFFPLGEQISQKTSEDLDIYSYGKTIQYLLAFMEIVPGLTKREEIKLRKVIWKCTASQRSNRFVNVSDIAKYLPKIEKT